MGAAYDILSVKTSISSSADSVIWIGSSSDSSWKSVEGVDTKWLNDRCKDVEYRGKKGELFHVSATESKFCDHILMGVGDAKDLTIHSFKKVVGSASRASFPVSKQIVVVISPAIIKALTTTGSEADLAQAVGDAWICGSYQFQGMKKESSDRKSRKVSVYVSKTMTQAQWKKGLKRGCHVGQGVCVARDLGNRPANDLTPAQCVKDIKQLFKGQSNVTVEVISAAQAKKKGLNAFLAVAQGSVEPPSLVFIRYNPGKSSTKPVALVGKGVTFDSGGISIKPSRGMKDMKGDMGGAAAVIGALSALVADGFSKPVIGIVPLVENMPSGQALKPGDVITAGNGKTIEITNTDAEGRLILADSLHLAVKESPSVIIDLATLTGAASVALGQAAIALMSNTPEVASSMKQASDQSGERVWELPLYDDYLDYLKSDVADIINANENRLAGTCTAGKFLEQFVDDQPWCHLDIAPHMKAGKTSGDQVKGMRGAGVRVITQFLFNR